MSVISAKSGTATWTPTGGSATVVPDARNLKVTDVANLQEYGSSGTQGGTGRKPGRSDHNGSFECYVSDYADLPFAKGDKGTLLLKSDGSSELFNGIARIGDIDWDVDIEGGGLVVATVNFGEDLSAN